MRSDRLRDVIDDIDNICINFRDEVCNYRDSGDLDRYHIALLVRDRLMRVYGDLTSAIDLFEVLEEER